MPEAQEAAIKDDNIMVDLDTTGKSVDVELDDSKANTKEFIWWLYFISLILSPIGIFSEKIILE